MNMNVRSHAATDEGADSAPVDAELLTDELKLVNEHLLLAVQPISPAEEEVT